MGSKAARSVMPQRLARAAVVILVVLGGSLTACEYTYDEGGRPDASPTSPPAGNVVLPPDPALEETVTGEALEEWAKLALPESQGSRSTQAVATSMPASPSLSKQFNCLEGRTR